MAAIPCPSCQTALALGPEHAGKMVRCPRCQTAFVVPPEREETATVTAVPVVDPPPPPQPEPPHAPTEDNPFAFKAYPGEEPATRNVQRPLRRKATWRQVRLGFDVVLCASLLLVAVLVCIAVTLQEETLTAETVERVLCLQGVGVVCLVVILIGQIQLTGVPPECGRGACIVSMLATLGILGVLVTAIYLTSQLLSADGGPTRELVELARIVPYLLLTAELVGVVAWYVFLVQFGRFHGATGLGAVCALAIGLNLLVFGILYVALTAGIHDQRSRQGRQRNEDKRLRQVPQRDEGGLGWIVVMGSGAVLLTLHVTALLKARSLIGTTQESG